MAEVNVSAIIPAKNEEATIGLVVSKLADVVDEIIVVDDGSSDSTAAIARENGAHVISHPYSIGNGSAIKTGARAAAGDIIVFMDGDGQHNPQDVPRLLAKLSQGYDMVVGNRDNKSQASFGRLAANKLYNRLASWMVGHRIRDLTSGFRVVRAEKFREFLYLLPNGFSYPTTSTMAFFRAGYSVCYEPIKAAKREGESHINLVKDGLRFLLIIFKVGTLYSPLKLFTPISIGVFALGFFRYIHTYLSSGEFTNMSALLFSTSLLIFLIGLVSEQMTMLIYQSTDNKDNE